MTLVHDPTLASRVGTTIAGKYRIARLLGAGGMGAVFEATNTWTERRVALKLMLADAAGDPELGARFLREARAASKVQHPNIVDVLDMGRDDADGALFLVQEFLVGNDLRRLLDERRVLPPREALELIVPVMSALVLAHRNGVVHRDLKPENIFLARTPAGVVVPKVIDFGIAKFAGGAEPAQGLTRTGAAMGTPYYMSPEQARGERTIDAQTDVWAIGVVLYEMLAGRGPFEGENYNQLLSAILTEEAPRLESLAAGVPLELANAVHGALVRDRGRRYRTMAQFLGVLLDCTVFEREGWHRTLRGTHRPSAAAECVGEDEGDRAPTVPSGGAAVALGAGVGGEAAWAPAKANGTTLGRTAREVESVRGGSGRGRTAVVIGVVAAAVTAVVAGTFASRREPARAMPASAPVVAGTPGAEVTYNVAVAVRPATASIEFDGAHVGVGAFARAIARDGTTHSMRIVADGYAPQVVTFRDAPPPGLIELAQLETDSARDATVRARTSTAAGAGGGNAVRRGESRVRAASARASATANSERPRGNDGRQSVASENDAQPRGEAPAANVRTGVNGAPVLEQ